MKCSPNTVNELEKRYCHIIDFINKKHITDLNVDEIEADELRTFIAKKDNTRWVYVALDRKSRMILHFHIGKRDTEDAKIFLSGLSHKLNDVSQVATDCLKSYISAVAKTPYGRIESAVSSIGLLRAKHLGEKLGRAITNRIETHNGNIRQHVSRMARKTRGFSRKEESLRRQLTLFFFYYNFIKRHKTLKTTPARVMRITNDEVDWESKLTEYDNMFNEMVDKPTERKRKITLPLKSSIGQKEKLDFIRDMAEKEGFKKKKKALVIPIAV